MNTKTSSGPDFPALLHYVAESRWQRTLIPVADESELTDHEAGPSGWASNGTRLIDSNLRVFDVRFVADRYIYAPTGETLSDQQLRELMASNLRSIRRAATKFESVSAGLSGRKLFEQTFRYAEELPMMSAGLHMTGCVAIAALCFLAFAIPIALVVWLIL
jgi:hypothetical protein